MLNPEQFAQRFTGSFRSLWLTALGMVHDAGWAEDVVQEAALVGLGKLDQFQPSTSFRAWMGQIVRFVALNKARKLQKPDRATLDPSVLEATAPQPSPSATQGAVTAQGQLGPDQGDFDDRLKRSLEGLAPLTRACLLLRSVEGLSYKEISQVLELPQSTAMSHVCRARQQLREALGQVHEGGA